MLCWDKLCVSAVCTARTSRASETAVRCTRQWGCSSQVRAFEGKQPGGGMCGQSDADMVIETFSALPITSTPVFNRSTHYVHRLLQIRQARPLCSRDLACPEVPPSRCVHQGTCATALHHTCDCKRCSRGFASRSHHPAACYGAAAVHLPRPSIAR